MQPVPHKSDWKIQSFTDLYAWQEGHKFVILMYKLVQTLPHSENFGLKLQIRRAAVSVTSNIAEGFSRQTHKEKLHFYSTALGSLTELQNQLLIARDVHAIAATDFQAAADQSVTVSKLINGLMRATKMKLHNS